MPSRKNRTKKELQRRRRLRQIVLAGLTGLIFTYFSVMLFQGERSLFKYLQVENTQRQLEEEVRQIEQENEQLRIRNRNLRENPDAIEAIAREKLGLAREGEVIYLFKNDQP